jgi:O-antigen ligase
LCLPAYGVEQAQNFGAWKGVFAQKNGLAETAVFAVVLFIFVRPLSRSLRCLGLAASFVLLYFARSATGTIVCFVIILTLPLYKLARARFAVVIPVGLMVGLLLAGSLLLLKSNAAEVLQLVNRSPDLTGRTDLWNAVLHSISKRPWLGYGYNAFWQGMNGESEAVLDAVHWAPGYAHNGFLDLTLHLGIVGLVAFVLGFVVLSQRALGAVLRATGPISMWLCTFLVFMLLYQLTEGSIMTQNDIYWVLYISCAVTLLSVFSPSQMHSLRK